jgi:SAM-dependent methyltransferase
MHLSALNTGKLFFETYLPYLKNPTVIDLGSQNVNGTLKDVCLPNIKYIGVDFVKGKGVDIILDNPYKLPFEDASIDVVVSSSCFEHSEMFWVVYLEILRILKPNGLFYLNVPSNGTFHRYPVDCWRFYPDSGNALVTWGVYSGYNPRLLESFTTLQNGDIYNDFAAIFVKDSTHSAQYPNRILNSIQNFRNGISDINNQFLNFQESPEDLHKVQLAQAVLNGSIR